jgi:RHS repeat-associated protein
VARYLTRDHLGSIRELTDAAGTVVTRNDYDPYGRLTRVAGTQDSQFGFTGHYVHAPSSLTLSTLRAYDSGNGRWLSDDPIGLAGGLNLQQYVKSNPIRYIDAHGTNPIAGALTGAEVAAIGGPAGAVVGGIVGGLLGLVVGELIWETISHKKNSLSPDFPYPGADPTARPGPDYEWRGKPGSQPGDKEGSWYNPKTGESLRPDVDHPPPIGPHWDYKDKDGDWWRKFPDGSACKK